MDTGVRYRPGLDGVRALAIAGVVLYHAQVTSVPGGFLGVDLFFVLSGFLITSLLLADRADHGRIRLGTFWLRRARRLLPAALLVIAVVLVVIACWHPGDLPSLRLDALASALYANNWRQVFVHRSYFASFGRPSLLQHYWSLSVEEQFYLVWPLALVALGRIRRGGLAALALAGAVASGVLMATTFDVHSDPSRVYYGTDTRAMPLLVGVALACVWPVLRGTRPVSVGARALLDLGGLGALGLVAVAMLRWTDYDPFVYRGGLALFAVAAAVLIGSVAHPATLLGRALGSRPLVWVGRRSYGMYLWHWPVMALSRPDLDVRWSLWALVPLQVAVTVALAALSYRFVEMPIRTGQVQRRLRASFEQLGRRERPLAVVSALGVVAVAIAAVAVWPTPRPSTVLRPVASAQALVPPTLVGEKTHHPRHRVSLPARPKPVTTRTPTSPPATTAAEPPSSAPRRPVLMVGASVMLAAIRDLHRMLHATVDAAVNRQPSDIIDRLRAYRNADALPPVVVVQIGENGPLTDFDERELHAVLRGVPRVVLMTLRYPGESWIADTNRRIEQLAARWPQATVADWRAASGNPALLWDGTHPNPQGAIVYARTVERAVDG